jgi:membrane-associated phospholipid phosphatase
VGRWARTLLAFGLVLAGAIGCGALLSLAERPGGSTGFDSSITTWVVAHRAAGLTTAARALSTLGSQAVLTPLAVAVALALLLRRRYVLAGSLVCAWGGAILLYDLTKDVVERPRPPTSLWLTNPGHSSAFPSGHATQSLATFLALAVVSEAWLSWPRLPGRAVAVALAAGVGWSRVYLGVHWTTDVVAGWLIAATWIAVVIRLARQ